MINKGAPAFARSASYSPGGIYSSSVQEGISTRDYFAAKALQALITTTNSWPDLGLTPIHGLDDQQQIARFAYMYADAMLSVSQKEIESS